MTGAGTGQLLRATLAAIGPASERAYQAALARWNGIAKPLDGLGMLERIVCRIAAASGSADVCVGKRALAVFCADNGVVAEGVSQSDASVTAVVARNLCEQATSVCRMGAFAGCEVVGVDMGMLQDIDDGRLLVRKCANGTGNIAAGPAMTRAQAEFALEQGIALSGAWAAQGYGLLAAGEMGIGNTTTSAAVACALLGERPAAMTGRGAGLSTAALQRKVAVVQRALDRNQPDAADAVDVLAKVGGYDIAAMCGFYLGAAANHVPVILDGFISCVAALCAVRLAPAAQGYLIASHVSTEPAAQTVLRELGLEAPLHAQMHLGEGTGAAALMPLIDSALAVYSEGRSFAASGMAAYEKLV